MKKYLQILTVIASLVFAVSMRAESQPYALGHLSSGSAEIEVIANIGGSISLYCDNQLVISYDAGGVTYAMSGVTWDNAGYGWGRIYYFLNGLPAGDYTVVVNTSGGQGSYSAHYNGGLVDEVQWNDSWGSYLYSYYRGYFE